MNLRASSDMSWRELTDFVKEDRRYAGQLYRMFEKKPFTLGSLHLHNTKRIMELRFEDIKDYGNLIFSGSKDTITLRSGLLPFQRDVTLFHELMHAWYYPYLNDFYSGEAHARALRNGARTEWLARNARAQPKLLREVVCFFELKKEIYDFSSYLAFRDYVGTPFTENLHSVQVD
ncbi:hypothetical protein HZA98_03275 [Candidatus Woesearchaeota archaeon]|nr:hypothetical protein [Candidatus Woesearchaeota archaeon]